MSINRDPEGSPEHYFPTERGRGLSNGSKYSDPKDVPLLFEESFSSVDSTTTFNSELQHYAEYSYISTDRTAEAIQECEKYVLQPYSNALKLIGWLPYKATRCGYAVQAVLVMVWFLCISATMVTQALSCFKRDAFVPGKTIAENTIAPALADSDSFDGNFSSDNTTFPPFTFSPSTKVISCERHIISSLLLLNVVVLATYLYGVYLFVRGESEYLFVLASHVFIKNAEAGSSSKKLIRTIQCVFIFGAVWLLFSLCVRVMTAVAVQLFDDDLTIAWPNPMDAHITLYGTVKISLLVISLLGFITFDILYMFSILNYVAQAEMNIYLIWDVRRLIEDKRYDHIDGGIKDTQKCKQYLDVLNGRTATLTALALFVLMSLALSSIIDLDRVDETKLLISEPFKILAGVSAFLNVVCWCLIVSLPFIQAARVSYWCDRLKDLAPEIRGRVSAAYTNDTLLDLDSLLSYLQNIRLEASLYGVPIQPWLLYLVAVAFSFTMLVLFQVDTYSIAEYI